MAIVLTVIVCATDLGLVLQQDGAALFREAGHRKRRTRRFLAWAPTPSRPSAVPGRTRRGRSGLQESFPAEGLHYMQLHVSAFRGSKRKWAA